MWISQLKTGHMKKQKPNVYNEEFKWRVVEDVLKGKYTKEEARRIHNIKSNCAVLYWMRKYSGINNYRQGGIPLGVMSDMAANKELQALQKRIEELEAQLQTEQLRADLWQKMIEVAEEQLGIDIKKKFGARQSSSSKQSEAKG